MVVPKEGDTRKAPHPPPAPLAGPDGRPKTGSDRGDAVGKSPSVQLRRSLHPGDFPRRSFIPPPPPEPAAKLRPTVGRPLRRLPPPPRRRPTLRLRHPSAPGGKLRGSPAARSALGTVPSTTGGAAARPKASGPRQPAR